VRDPDGVDMIQHLFSSVVNNYVTYHVIKSSQQMWTLDDFENVSSSYIISLSQITRCYSWRGEHHIVICSFRGLSVDLLSKWKLQEV